jgi:hypothetical protein
MKISLFSVAQGSFDRSRDGQRLSLLRRCCTDAAGRAVSLVELWAFGRVFVWSVHHA